MERYEKQGLDKSDQNAAMHDVLHEAVYERVRAGQRRQRLTGQPKAHALVHPGFGGSQHDTHRYCGDNVGKGAEALCQAKENLIVAGEMRAGTRNKAPD